MIKTTFEGSGHKFSKKSINCYCESSKSICFQRNGLVCQSSPKVSGESKWISVVFTVILSVFPKESFEVGSFQMWSMLPWIIKCQLVYLAENYSFDVQIRHSCVTKWKLDLPFSATFLTILPSCFFLSFHSKLLFPLDLCTLPSFSFDQRPQSIFITSQNPCEVKYAEGCF